MSFSNPLVFRQRQRPILSSDFPIISDTGDGNDLILPLNDPRRHGNYPLPTNDPPPNDDRAHSRARSRKDPALEGRYTLLSCLACAQARNIDFTGLSWVDAQGTLGRGGQGVVAQARAGIDAAFAFKRRRPPAPPPPGTAAVWDAARVMDHAFREICSEIMALGHENLRRHDNIARLVAIGLEMEGAETWALGGDVVVWPVMILEKAEYGDLGRFLRGGQGFAATWETRLEMCAGIAAALSAVHQSGIVHGDIKPENVLVSKDQVVKVSDFGFSVLASSKILELGGTLPWRAPELTWLDGVTLAQAKLTDLYSFGMLCLWVIFRNTLEKMGTGAQWPDLALFLLRNRPTLNENGMADLAHNLLVNGSQIPPGRVRDTLGSLLARLLSFDPGSRVSPDAPDTAADFAQISETFLELCNKNAKPPSNGVHSPQDSHPPRAGGFPQAAAFQVADSLTSLCETDFRIRKHIFNCLLYEYIGTQRRGDAAATAAIAAQLAFCKEVGFGAAIDGKTAEAYRRAAGIDLAEVQAAINRSQNPRPPFNDRLGSLYDRGIINPMDYGVDFRSHMRPDALLETYKARNAEIERMQAALGRTHPAVLNLKWPFSHLLVGIEGPMASAQYLHGIMQDLGGNPTTGANGREALIARGCFCLSLGRMAEPITVDMIRDYTLETHNALVHGGLGSHGIAHSVRNLMFDILTNLGEVEEARRFLGLAGNETARNYGPDHVVTVMMLDKDTDRLVREGRIAEALDNVANVSKRMDGLVDRYHKGRTVLRRKHAKLLAIAGRFEEALVLADADLAATDEGHSAFAGASLFRSQVLLALNRFPEAAAGVRRIIPPLMNTPWPPPRPPPPRRPRRWQGGQATVHAQTRAQEMALMLGKEDDTPAPELLPRTGTGLGLGVDPELPAFDAAVLPDHPHLLVAQALHAACLHSWVQQVQKAGPGAGSLAHENAALLRERADADLSDVLQAIDDKLGAKTLGTAVSSALAVALRDVGAEEASCRKRSAILRAADSGFIPLMDLISFLGIRNAREGLHNEMALAVARARKLSRVTELLAEHRLLCGGNEPSADGPAIFADAGALARWVTGPWTGSSHHPGGVDRKIPTGRKTITMEGSAPAGDSKGGGWDVDITGTFADEVGMWLVRGQAWVSGKIVLWMSFVKAYDTEGWEWTAQANLERGAFGGYFGIKNVPRQGSGGTFLFYKY